MLDGHAVECLLDASEVDARPLRAAVLAAPGEAAVLVVGEAARALVEEGEFPFAALTCPDVLGEVAAS